MAFTSTVTGRDSGGTYNIVRGTWTSGIGDAEGTVTGGGYALHADFLDNDSTSPGQSIPVRISNSSNTWTVTVPTQGTITSGIFSIQFK